MPPKHADSFIRELVDGYNTLPTRKERVAFLKEKGIRFENLRGLAIRRGFKLKVYASRKARKATSLAAKKRWAAYRKAKKTGGPSLQATHFRVNRKLPPPPMRLDPVEALRLVTVRFAEVDMLKSKIARIKEILEEV